MKFHEILRQRRLALGLTQEQLAQRLGVSAPAVNKWERNNSYPDITLLPPLARLLEVDLNTLLSFQEELTEEEIGAFANVLGERAQQEGCEAAFRLARDKLREYPNSDLLAYTAAHTGGDFSKESRVNEYMDSAAETLLAGGNMEEMAGELKYYDYYLEAYTAVLGGMVGEYQIQEPSEEGEEPVWARHYGLKTFHPIAKGFPYSDYDDFGVSRSYGYKRQHLGHDMMGQTGTPVIAVESGTVEALGWNQYGGWRIGIRSFDKKRYYYYAHLRKGFPYALDLEEGDAVQAGDVIGYMGRTGYSATEDVNNIDEPHLHFGIQLIFDESQKEGNSEIWIDCYQIVRFLYQNRSECVRNDETKEWSRKYQMIN